MPVVNFTVLRINTLMRALKRGPDIANYQSGRIPNQVNMLITKLSVVASNKNPQWTIVQFKKWKLLLMYAQKNVCCFTQTLK